MERSAAASTSSKTNCRSHCGHSKTSGNIAFDCRTERAVCPRNSLLDDGVCPRVASMPFVRRAVLARASLLGGRSTVGQLALDQHIGVRIPASQPRFLLLTAAIRTRTFWYSGCVPEICRFFGIVITMNFNDHNPPHFHARYGSSAALFTIDPIAIYSGELPPRAIGLIIEWASQHRTELVA